MIKGISEYLERAIGPLKNKVALMIARGVLDSVDDDKKIQLLKLALLKDEVSEDVERFQDYGLTSNPPPGSEAVIIHLGGSRSHPLAIRVDNRKARKIGLKPGEVALYTDEEDFIKFCRGNKIEVNTKKDLEVVAGNSVTVNCDSEVEVNTTNVSVNAMGNAEVSATNITATASTKAEIESPLIKLGSGASESVVKGEAFLSLFNAHTHGSAVGPTSNPLVPATSAVNTVKVRAE